MRAVAVFIFSLFGTGLMLRRGEAQARSIKIFVRTEDKLKQSLGQQVLPIRSLKTSKHNLHNSASKEPGRTFDVLITMFLPTASGLSVCTHLCCLVCIHEMPIYILPSASGLAVFPLSSQSFRLLPSLRFRSLRY